MCRNWVNWVNSSWNRVRNECVVFESLCVCLWYLWYCYGCWREIWIEKVKKTQIQQSFLPNVTRQALNNGWAIGFGTRKGERRRFVFKLVMVSAFIFVFLYWRVTMFTEEACSPRFLYASTRPGKKLPRLLPPETVVKMSEFLTRACSDESCGRNLNLVIVLLFVRAVSFV